MLKTEDLKPSNRNRRIGNKQWACRCIFCNQWYIGTTYNSNMCSNIDCISLREDKYKASKRNWYHEKFSSQAEWKERREAIKRAARQSKSDKIYPCQNCGENAYPNRLLCKACLNEKIRREGDNDEY